MENSKYDLQQMSKTTDMAGRIPYRLPLRRQ